MDLNEVLGLRGLPVCIGLSAATLTVLVAGTALLPRRVARHGRARASDHGLQVTAMLLVAALAVASCFAWINRATVMYPTWSDLVLGAGAPATSRFGAHPAASPATADPSWRSAVTAPVSALQRDPLHDGALSGVRATSSGQWIRLAAPPRASDVTSPVLVHLPAGYLGHPERRYPVLLAFNGIPGSPLTFRDAFGLGEELDALASRHELASTIVVAPQAFPAYEDTECVDAAPRPNGPHRFARGSMWETWIARDVVDAARTHLRTVEDPAAWATFGYSAGGWCASMLAVRHPDIARTSISMAGYFTPDYEPGLLWTRPDDPRYDLPRRVREDAPGVSMYLFMGADDPLPQPSLASMRAALEHGGASLTVRATPRGGHALTLWIDHTPDALAWLRTAAPAFRA